MVSLHFKIIEVADQTLGIDNEEMILRNTYINALLLSQFPCPINAKKLKKKRELVWIDSNNTEEKQPIATVIEDSVTDKIHVKVNGFLKTAMKKTDPVNDNNLQNEYFTEFEDQKGPDMFAVPIGRSNPKYENRKNFIL